MILWKNINLRDKGIIVEKTPIPPKGKKRIDTYTIEGRNGFLSVDTGNYDPFSYSLPCHFHESANRDDICNFLDGYGTLSFDGLREYTAIIQNSISFEKLSRFKKFIIQFLINPIAEDINPTEKIINNNSETFEIKDATYKMFPILEITGIGDLEITFNNETFNLQDINGKYVLDCKEQVITHNGLNASSKMLHSFPHLIPGINTISYIGNITSFKIIYKKAYV